MGFIKIVENAESRTGWHSVWDQGEPRGEGWEAVCTRNRATWEVRLDGVPRGRVVARDPRSGRPSMGYAFQGEVGVAPERAVNVGCHSLSVHEPAEDVAKSYTTGAPVPTERHAPVAVRR